MEESKIKTWQQWSDIIHPLIQKSLQENQFTNPTEVQSNVLANYKYCSEFIVASQTGSGKTLAFGVPILSDLIFKKTDPQGALLTSYINQLSCLVIAPTRELALQIEKHLKLINKNSEHLIKIGSLLGGISKAKQNRILSYKPDILVCTPGRLWDMLDTDVHPYLQNINQIRYLVIDEADRMVEAGHFEDLDKILARIFQQGKEIQVDKQAIEMLNHDTEQPHLYINQGGRKMLDNDYIRKLEQGDVIEMTESEFKTRGNIIQQINEKKMEKYLEKANKKREKKQLKLKSFEEQMEQEEGGEGEGDEGKGSDNNEEIHDSDIGEDSKDSDMNSEEINDNEDEDINNDVEDEDLLKDADDGDEQLSNQDEKEENDEEEEPEELQSLSDQDEDENSEEILDGQDSLDDKLPAKENNDDEAIEDQLEENIDNEEEEIENEDLADKNNQFQEQLEQDEENNSQNEVEEQSFEQDEEGMIDENKDKKKKKLNKQSKSGQHIIKQQKKIGKKKIFLVSATLTKQFYGSKFKLNKESKEEIKQQKKQKKQEKKLKKKENQENKNQDFEQNNHEFNKEGPSEKGKNPQDKDKNILGLEKNTPKLMALIERIKFQGKPKVIDLTQNMIFPSKLQEIKTNCLEEDKTIHLYHYIQQRQDQNFIVFFNSITYAKKIFHLLEILSCKCVLLHSEMQQRQRLNKLDKFRSNEANVLICTDVAARGLDIPLVKNVVHFQVPLDVDTYIHRSGRTARIGQNGISYVLVGPKDKKRYDSLCRQLNKEQGIENLEITAVEKDKIQKLLDQATVFESSKFQLDKKKQEQNWFKKFSQTADIEIDEETKKEMEELNEEVNKKQKIQKDEKNQFKVVQRNIKNIDRKRRNAVYLDPSQIQEFAQKMRKMKDQQAFQAANKKNNNNSNKNSQTKQNQGKDKSKKNKKNNKNFEKDVFRKIINMKGVGFNDLL